VRVLATLLPATDGRVVVAGYDARRNSLEVRASIGYIPQALSADGALTARENLEFYARVTAVPRAARAARIADAPAGALLDEPTVGLDPNARTCSSPIARRGSRTCSSPSPAGRSRRREGGRKEGTSAMSSVSAAS
jgi:ABC-type multidrug transport system ATPase subunit